MHRRPERDAPSGFITEPRSAGDPPTFMLYVNNPELAHFTYLRYLENQIRKDYPFIGTPIRLVFEKAELIIPLLEDKI